MTQKEDIKRVNSEIGGEITKSNSFFENQWKRKNLRRKLDSIIKHYSECYRIEDTSPDLTHSLGSLATFLRAGSVEC